MMHQNNLSMANYSHMSGFGKPYEFDTLNSVSKDNTASRDMFPAHNNNHNTSFMMGQDSHEASSTFLGIGEDSTQRNFFS